MGRTDGPGLSLGGLWRATRFAVAAAIVALFGGFLLTALLIQPDGESVPAGISTSPSEASYVVGGDVLFGRFRTISSMATEEALWVPGPNGLIRIDHVPGPKTTFPGLTEVRSLASTEDAVWAVEPDAVYRIDRDSLEVTDSIEASTGLGFSRERPLIVEGSLWMTSTQGGRSTLVEIDPDTRSIWSEYTADDDLTPGGLIAVDDAIWVHSQVGGGEAQRLTRFDLESRAFTDAIDIPGTESRECCIALDDAIWLVDQNGLVERFDLDTFEITDRIELDRHPDSRVSGGVAADGAIWVSAGDVYRIDPRAREVTDVIEVGWSSEPPAFLHGAIWVAGHGDQAARIDVRTREVTDTFRMSRTHLHTPLASEGVIWVYTQEGSVHRIDEVAATE